MVFKINSDKDYLVSQIDNWLKNDYGILLFLSNGAEITVKVGSTVTLLNNDFLEFKLDDATYLVIRKDAIMGVAL